MINGKIHGEGGAGVIRFKRRGSNEKCSAMTRKQEGESLARKGKRKILPTFSAKEKLPHVHEGRGSSRSPVIPTVSSPFTGRSRGVRVGNLDLVYVVYEVWPCGGKCAGGTGIGVYGSLFSDAASAISSPGLWSGRIGASMASRQRQQLRVLSGKEKHYTIQQLLKQRSKPSPAPPPCSPEQSRTPPSAMASCKLLTTAVSSSIRRFYRLASSPLLPPPASRRLPVPLLSARFCSAAAAATAPLDAAYSAVAVATAAAPAPVDAASSAVAAVSEGHPWPEWADFLEKLRAKGYFVRPPLASGAPVGEEVAADAVGKPDYPFRDQNRVKNACLNFARERFDLLSSLPKKDIQAIVECGCPNIFRKAVSSAKRLREFVQVDEGDACSVCKLRGSCDKAYVIPKAEEAARTVDVVRILLTYAIDPATLSGENSVGGGVQESARKLLSDLTMLCDTTIDPSLPKPVIHTYSKQDSSTKPDKGKQSSRVSAGKGRETAVTEMKKGDWLCPKCAFMNFSRNKMCFKCEGQRPKRQLNPGEWECPSCDFVNFRRNQECKKCSHDRPEDDTQDNKLGYDVWRNTKGAGKDRSFDSVHQGDDDGNEEGLPYKGEERRHVASRRASPARREFTGKSRNHGDEDNALPYEGGDRRVSSRRASPARKGFAKNDDGNEDVEFDVSPYDGERKHGSSRRAAPGRRGFTKDEDDVLPYEGARKHVVSRRATPSQRRFTAARGE
uniref:Zinc finger protein VAR3, chloroplastic n=1 Tax=Aegilops tauschii TaxID=37682 RepID=N1R381_AEGTA